MVVWDLYFNFFFFLYVVFPSQKSGVRHFKIQEKKDFIEDR